MTRPLSVAERPPRPGDVVFCWHEGGGTETIRLGEAIPWPVGFWGIHPARAPAGFVPGHNSGGFRIGLAHLREWYYYRTRADGGCVTVPADAEAGA